LNIEPGKSFMKRLVITDPGKESKLSYSYGFKVTQAVESEEELINLIKKKGSKKQIKNKEGDEQIFYYYLLQGEKYYFFYQNKEAK
jgi:hypothetical protein